MSKLPAALVTGASSGIGATYADRLARRGHDLILVARDTARLEAAATRLRAEAGVQVEVLTADLTDPADLSRVEARLRDDADIGLLVNNAGMAVAGGLAQADAAAIDKLLALNVTALTRLTHAALPGLVERKGAIINIASVLGLAPEVFPGAYPATKAYVLSLSQGLQAELGAKGLYVQAVLPAATRTEIWERSGLSVEQLEGVMDVGEMVDAALVGFDRREPVTIPPLPDAGQWEAFERARLAMAANFRNAHAAARYREPVAA